MTLLFKNYFLTLQKVLAAISYFKIDIVKKALFIIYLFLFFTSRIFFLTSLLEYNCFTMLC